MPNRAPRPYPMEGELPHRRKRRFKPLSGFFDGVYRPARNEMENEEIREDERNAKLAQKMEDRMLRKERREAKRQERIREAARGRDVDHGGMEEGERRSNGATLPS